jgi:hypothetical protein
VCARVVTPQLGTSSAGVRALEADGASVSCACMGGYTEAGVSAAGGLMSRNTSRRCERFSAQYWREWSCCVVIFRACMHTTSWREPPEVPLVHARNSFHIALQMSMDQYKLQYLRVHPRARTKCICIEWPSSMALFMNEAWS